MANTIQVRRGSKAALPALAAAEFGFCTDTLELFVGDSVDNHQLILSTTFNAKGSLLTATSSGTVAILDAGPDGTILTADSNEVSGIRWGSSPVGITWVVISGSTTASPNTGYLIDASAADVTLFLSTTPAIGYQIAISDFTKSATTHVITLDRGGNNIEGAPEDLIIDIDGAGFTLVYAGGEIGWEITSQIGYDYVDDAIFKSIFNANTILAANEDNIPLSLEIAEQTLLGRITSGNIAALTPTQIRTLINVEDGAKDNTSLITTTSGILQGYIDNKSDSSHLHDGRYYTETEVDTISGSIQTTINSLDYYTTFEVDTISGSLQSSINSLDYYTTFEVDTISGSLQNAIGLKSDVGHSHDDLYYTENEIDAIVSGITGTIATLSGSLSGAIDYKNITGSSGDYYISIDDYTIVVDGSSVPANGYLPTASGIDGKIYNIKCINSTYPCYIVSSGTENIDGSPNNVSIYNMESITLQAYNNSWLII